MTSGARSPPPLWIQHPTPQRSERYHSPHRLRSHVHLTERFLIPRNPSSTPGYPPSVLPKLWHTSQAPKKYLFFFGLPESMYRPSTSVLLAWRVVT